MRGSEFLPLESWARVVSISSPVTHKSDLECNEQSRNK